MPYDGSAGWSEETRVKQEQLAYILRVWLPIVAGITGTKKWADPAFHWIDLTAGPGAYEDGSFGSPLIFAEAAHAINIRYYAWLIEQNEETAERLCAAIGERYSDNPPTGALRVLREDHNDALPRIADHYRARSKPCYGLLYCDTNGDARLPVDGIRNLLSVPACKYMDVLCYVSGTSRKRAIGAGVEGVNRLLEDLHALGKRYLQLRAPHGREQWTFALASNWRHSPRMNKIGFYSLDEDAGRHIAMHLNLTAKEIDALVQPAFFAPAPPTDPTPNTCGTRVSARYGRKSSRGPAGSANDAEDDRQLNLTI